MAGSGGRAGTAAVRRSALVEVNVSSQETEVLVVGGGQAGIAMSEHLSSRYAAPRRSSAIGSPSAGVRRGGTRWSPTGLPGMTASRASSSRPRLRRLRPQGPGGGLLRRLRREDRRAVHCGVEVRSVRQEHRSSRLSRRDVRGERSTRGSSSRPPGRSRSPSSRPSFPTAPVGTKSTPATTATRAAARRWRAGRRGRVVRGADRRRAAPGRPRRLPVGRTARPSAARPTAVATSVGGSVSWASGTSRRRRLGAEHVTIAVSGAHGGHTVDFRRSGRQRHHAARHDRPLRRRRDDLRAGPRENIERVTPNYLSMLDEADAYVARNGVDLPEEPQARVLGPDPDCVTDPIRSLDLAVADVTSIVWATGFASDYGWLQVDAFDERRQAAPPPGRLDRAGNLLPRPAVAVPTRIELHLGRLARRQVPRRPHRHPTQLSRVRGPPGLNDYSSSN